MRRKLPAVLCAGILCMACTVPDSSGPKESCGSESVKEDAMRLYVNGTYIPVIWEENASVYDLEKQCAEEKISVPMKMLFGSEQCGYLGRSYVSDDYEQTAYPGDIMLYDSANIVLFFGENTWAYTKLGRMDLPQEKVNELLSCGDVLLELK